MRTWTMPPWVAEQDEAAKSRAWATIKDYSRGSGDLRLFWWDTYRIKNEAQQESMVKLIDRTRGHEYVLDKEELLHFLRYA